MQKLIYTSLLVCFLFLLFSNSAFPQSNDEIKLVRAEKAKSYPTTFGTEYFVTPSAIPREKGQFSLHNAEIRLLSASYGLTNNISFNAGFNLGSLFNKYEEVLPYLTTKVGFEIAPKLYVGGGLLVVDIYSADLIGFGMVTLGDRNANITLTYIYDFNEGGISGGDDFKVVSPISLSGMYRVNKYLSFVSENHFPNRNNRSLYYFAGFEGIRLIFKKHAIDLGTVVTADRSIFFTNQREIRKRMNYGWDPFLGYTFAF